MTLNLMSSGTLPAAAARRSSIELSAITMQRVGSEVCLPLLMALAPLARLLATAFRGRAIAEAALAPWSNARLGMPERRLIRRCDTRR